MKKKKPLESEEDLLLQTSKTFRCWVYISLLVKQERRRQAKTFKLMIWQ